MHHPRSSQRPNGFAYIGTFGIAVALNFPWEVAQARLYNGADQWPSVIWHCFVASLGDGLLFVLVFVLTRLVLHRNHSPPSAAMQTAQLIVLAALVGILVEWVGLGSGLWSYTASMPLIPVADVGVVPVAQMMMLMPLTFWLVAKWIRR